jgi:hypothetical protein
MPPALRTPVAFSTTTINDAVDIFELGEWLNASPIEGWSKRRLKAKNVSQQRRGMKILF